MVQSVLDAVKLERCQLLSKKRQKQLVVICYIFSLKTKLYSTKLFPVMVQVKYLCCLHLKVRVLLRVAVFGP